MGCLLGVFLGGAVSGFAVPLVTGISPNYGTAGTQVIITGSGFTTGGFPSVTAVKFYNNVAASFTVTADTQIQTVVPAGAVTGPVRVESPSGNTTTNNFLVIGRQPYIDSFDPITGATNSSVTIIGLNLTNPATIRFGGKAASAFLSGQVGQSERMVATVPLGALSGPISASNSFGIFTTSSNFVVTTSAPVVDYFSPFTGPTNIDVTISGLNVTNATNVLFNGVPSKRIQAGTGQDQIRALVPAGATTGPIKVVNRYGTNTTSSNFVVTTTAPFISDFSPTFGPTNTIVTIQGINFTGATAVKFNGTNAAAFNVVSVSQISARVQYRASTGPITVINATGTNTTSSNFVVTGGAPFISGFSPFFGTNGTVVRIDGVSLIDATSVRFGTNPAVSFSAVSSVQIQATVPSGATTGPISVGNSFGTNTTTTNFFLPPQIAGFSPTHAAITAPVTISGTNFIGTTVVQFNGNSTSFTVTAPGSIQAVVPAGATNGFITVITPGGATATAIVFVVDPSADLSVTLAASPDPVFVTSNVTFIALISNNGPDPALGVTLTDVLPSNLVFVAASGGTVSTNGNQVTVSVGTINSGGSATVNIIASPLLSGFVTNSVSVTGTRYDPVPANNTATVTVGVLPLPILFIRLLSNQMVEISWPAPLSNFVLQSADRLLRTNNVWTNVVIAPVTIGSSNTVTAPLTGTNRFFRLKK